MEYEEDAELGEKTKQEGVEEGETDWWMINKFKQCGVRFLR